MKDSEDGLMFYRCMLCSGVVSVWDIKKHGGCNSCGGTRIRPTNLTLWEKILQVFKQPRIWEWKHANIAPIDQSRQEAVREDVGGNTDTV